MLWIGIFLVRVIGVKIFNILDSLLKFSGNIYLALHMVEMGPDPFRSGSAKLMLTGSRSTNADKRSPFYKATVKVPIRFKSTAALHVSRHIQNVLIYIYLESLN